jgi:hypothetical protein
MCTCMYKVAERGLDGITSSARALAPNCGEPLRKQAPDPETAILAPFLESSSMPLLTNANPITCFFRGKSCIVRWICIIHLKFLLLLTSIIVGICKCASFTGDFSSYIEASPRDCCLFLEDHGVNCWLWFQSYKASDRLL